MPSTKFLVSTLFLALATVGCTYEVDSYEYTHAGLYDDAVEMQASGEDHFDDYQWASTGGDDGGDRLCGDGQLDPGEECDDGLGNGENEPCNLKCEINVCGDGVILQGSEECDNGVANGPLSACSADCELAQ